MTLIQYAILFSSSYRVKPKLCNIRNNKLRKSFKKDILSFFVVNNINLLCTIDNKEFYQAVIILRCISYSFPLLTAEIFLLYNEVTKHYTYLTVFWFDT